MAAYSSWMLLKAVKNSTNCSLTKYSKTRDIGHPWKSATKGHYCITWPPPHILNLSHKFMFSGILYVSSALPVGGRHKLLYSFLWCVVHGPKFSFISRNNSCPNNRHSFVTTDWNFLVATHPLLYFKSLFVDGVIYLRSDSTRLDSTRLDSALRTVHLHSSIFILPRGFPRLVICRSWVALNGTKCGQHWEAPVYSGLIRTMDFEIGG